MLNGRTFRTQLDPWRGISRCAFGLDYLKQYDARRFASTEENYKMMELNTYDESEYPTYGLDVFVQRVSVYVQRNEGSYIPVGPEVENPYARAASDRRHQHGADHRGDHHVPILDSLDNGK